MCVVKDLKISDEERKILLSSLNYMLEKEKNDNVIKLYARLLKEPKKRKTKEKEKPIELKKEENKKSPNTFDLFRKALKKIETEEKI